MRQNFSAEGLNTDNILHTERVILLEILKHWSKSSCEIIILSR